MFFKENRSTLKLEYLNIHSVGWLWTRLAKAAAGLVSIVGWSDCDQTD